MERFRRYYRRFRNLPDEHAPTDGNSTFSVPLIQWQVFGKWADAMQQLLGDDAEVVAEPVGPADQRIVHKVGRYMTWRVFRYMKLARELSIFTFRAILFGRSHAYRPWKRETYLTPAGERVAYDGPGFEALWPDDVIVPAEDARTIQDFSFVIRKFRITPQQLLEGERRGLYSGVKKHFERIVVEARQKRRDYEDGADQMKREKDEAEGVTYEGSLTDGGTLRVWEWYGRWRLPKKGRGSPDLNDFKGRELDETDLRVRYLPDLKLVISVDRLDELYPLMKNRRPFAECALIHDGSTGRRVSGNSWRASRTRRRRTTGCSLMRGRSPWGRW